MANKDQDFVDYVVKAFVDYPEDVKTERRIDEMGVLLELTVNPKDMGKIIGKEGRTAKALRTLLRVLGAKENARINLKIIEPEGKEEVKATENKEEKDTTELPKLEV
ncbi:MAG: KH domain-containing protein [Candidatus Berkelbacteria bacterium]|nr:KH domain-containing protein [Candidatus Berkelbacteria bacterium]